MAWIILATVIALPIIEIALFIKSAQWVGLLPTIIVAIGAGMVGLALIRRQGLDLAWRARAQMERGEVPLQQAFDAICLAVAGGLLLLPGFFTDILAIFLLLPPIRAFLRGWLERQSAGRRGGGPSAPSQPRVIEADYVVVEEENRNRDR